MTKKYFCFFVYKLFLPLKQTYAVLFDQKLEFVQCNLIVAITVDKKGTSAEKLYNELSLEPVVKRRRFRKLCCILK